MTDERTMENGALTADQAKDWLNERIASATATLDATSPARAAVIRAETHIPPSEIAPQEQAQKSEPCEVCGVKNNAGFRCRACADRATIAQLRAEVERLNNQMSADDEARVYRELSIIRRAAELIGDPESYQARKLQQWIARATKAKADLERVTRERNDAHERIGHWVRRLESAEAKLAAAGGNAHLRTLVQEAADQLRFYEAQHRSKGTPEGDEKANTRRRLAERLEAALSQQPQGGGR